MSKTSEDTFRGFTHSYGFVLYVVYCFYVTLISSFATGISIWQNRKNRENPKTDNNKTQKQPPRPKLG